MKSFTLYFSLSLVFLHCTLASDASNCAKGPDPAYCGRPSAISNLVCFLSGLLQPGQSALFIGFDDYIAAFCTFYYDCQPAQRAYLNILDVYGYIFNLTYTMKNGTKGFHLYYIDVTVPGCPQFQEVTEPPFVEYGYDVQLIHTPKPVGVAYYSYQTLFQDTNLSCNTFPSIKVQGDDCSGNQFSNCPYRSPYNYKTPLASLDFSHLKNVALYGDPPQQDNQTLPGGQILVDDNGLYATCVLQSNATVDDDGDPQLIEYCTADRYDNFPYCNRLNERNSLSKIIESYGYDEYLKCGLNANSACTISTLYAQGYNKAGGCHNKDYSNCNCNSFTTFASFGFLLPEFNAQNLGIYRILTKGYVEIGFKQDIMRKFLSIC